VNPQKLGDAWKEAVTEANRAPSVHNVQPARWALESDRVVLYGDESRRLAIGDPSGHDHRVSLGAAFEGMKIALSRHGWTLGEPELPPPALIGTGGFVASARVEPAEPSAPLDPLAPWVFKRASWRGKFQAASPGQLELLKSRLTTIPHAKLVTDPAKIRELMKFADRATLEFNTDPAYFRELYSWLRFSPAHPEWSRDGLNADSMSLSWIERLAASLLMKPAVFSALARLGLAGALVAESPKGNTSSAVCYRARVLSALARNHRCGLLTLPDVGGLGFAFGLGRSARPL